MPLLFDRNRRPTVQDIILAIAMVGGCLGILFFADKANSQFRPGVLSTGRLETAILPSTCTCTVGYSEPVAREGFAREIRWRTLIPWRRPGGDERGCAEVCTGIRDAFTPIVDAVDLTQEQIETRSEAASAALQVLESNFWQYLQAIEDAQVNLCPAQEDVLDEQVWYDGFIPDRSEWYSTEPLDHYTITIDDLQPVINQLLDDEDSDDADEVYLDGEISDSFVTWVEGELRYDGGSGRP